MILALLACTHTPPVLFAPLPDRAELGDIPPATGPQPDVSEDGRLLVTVEDWARLKTRSRLLTSAVDDRDLAYRSWAADTERGNVAYAATALDAHQRRQEAAGLRVGVVTAAVLGLVVGAGTAVGVAWAYPR